MATLNDNASLVRRPDAISFDYLTAFSFGPVRQADQSLGALDRVWRVRYDAGNVYLARTSDDGTAFVAEVLLFNFAAPEAIEIDLAFDQQANVVVTVERATGAGGSSELWIYYFSSLTASYVFENFGPGRTPRALLDDPLDPTTNDVLVFYVDDANGRISYRQQRDRYAVVYALSESTALNIALEDVYKATDNRVHVLYSVHDPVTGRYYLQHRESSLYPYFGQIGEFQMLSSLPQSAGSDLDRVTIPVFPFGYVDPDGILPDAWLDLENFQMAIPTTPVAGDLHETFVLSTLYDLDQFQLFNPVAQPGGTLVAPVIFATLFDVDEFKMVNPVPQPGGTLPVVVILKDLFDVDTFKMVNPVPQAGGTLV
jgi:hypothetical protein